MLSVENKPLVLSAFMLNVNAECRYAEYRKHALCAESRYAECRYAECHYSECRYTYH